ncbi:hypothetical protein KC460_04175 [Candidatus Dependentiae bacterium]|nr:hypothetical protein [Candidatus Dependentiae bacterium]
MYRKTIFSFVLFPLLLLMGVHSFSAEEPHYCDEDLCKKETTFFTYISFIDSEVYSQMIEKLRKIDQENHEKNERLRCELKERYPRESRTWKQVIFFLFVDSDRNKRDVEFFKYRMKENFVDRFMDRHAIVGNKVEKK